MRKIHKKVITGALALTLLLTNVIVVSADSYTGSINGNGFTAYSNISYSGASAGTVSSSSQLSMSVSSTYYYINFQTQQSGTQGNYSSATAAASLSFSAPNNCKSFSISSSHTASSGVESWSGSTSARYY